MALLRLLLLLRLGKLEGSSEDPLAVAVVAVVASEFAVPRYCLKAMIEWGAMLVEVQKAEAAVVAAEAA